MVGPPNNEKITILAPPLLLTRMHPSGVTSNGLRFCLVCINLSSTIT